MKVKTVRSSWWEGSGYRLDCQPYLAGGLEAKIILERLPVRKDKLHTVTTGHNGGIYHAGRESRQWVDSKEFGVPFISSSDLLSADLSSLPFLSKNQVENTPLFVIRKGWTLITRSGTIGKMAYARAEMDGLACSEHVMRIVPDVSKIPSGYLYAYLQSKFGIPLVVSGTYGSIIQSIEPEHIADLPVPRLEPDLERRIHDLIEEAGHLRTKGNHVIAETSKDLVDYLSLSPLTSENVAALGSEVVRAQDLHYRLDPHFHSRAAIEAELAVKSGRLGYEKLSSVTQRLFKPPIFKRLPVQDAEFGTQFISGNDAYKFRSSDVRFVSKLTPHHDEFILQRGWLIFQAAGQIYGLFARPLYVNGWLEGLFCADDVFRVVPKTEEDGAFLFAFFRTSYGRILLQRQSAGDSIPRVWDPQVSQVVVPWPNEKIRGRFSKPIIEAHEWFEDARQKEDRAISSVEETLEQLGRK